MDVVRADIGLEHGVALPVWDALLRGEADDLATLAQKASRRLGHVPAARGQGRRARPPRLAASRSARGIKRIDAPPASSASG